MYKKIYGKNINVYNEYLHLKHRILELGKWIEGTPANDLAQVLKNTLKKSDHATVILQNIYEFSVLSTLYPKYFNDVSMYKFKNLICDNFFYLAHVAKNINEENDLNALVLGNKYILANITKHLKIDEHILKYFNPADNLYQLSIFYIERACKFYAVRNYLDSYNTVIKAYKLNPQIFASYYKASIYYANAAYKINHYEEAYKVFLQVESMKSESFNNDYASNVNFAEAAFKTNHYKDAYKAYERAESLDPKFNNDPMIKQNFESLKSLTHYLIQTSSDFSAEEKVNPISNTNIRENIALDPQNISNSNFIDSISFPLKRERAEDEEEKPETKKLHMESSELNEDNLPSNEHDMYIIGNILCHQDID